MHIMSRTVAAVALGVTAALVSVTSSAGASPASSTQITQHPSHAAVSGTQGPAAMIKPVTLHLTAAEETEWQRLITTEVGRAQVVSQLKSAFAGVATVGAGTSTPVPGGGMHTDLATGITGDHFWIVVSYADVVSGAIWAGVRACQMRLPGWLCTVAGNLLANWASGWGSANNHGVWAAIYWLPPHVEGGRW